MFFRARTPGEGQREQSTEQHIKNVVKCIEEKANALPFQKTAMLAGYLHDVGKYSNKWMEYLESEGEGATVPHSLAGMLLAVELFDNIRSERNDTNESRFEKDIHSLTQDWITYAVGAHHGMFDFLDSHGDCKTDHKLKSASIEEYAHSQECKENYYTFFDKEHLLQLGREAKDETGSFVRFVQENRELFRQRLNLHYLNGICMRMILSRVIDADWSDAAGYYDSQLAEWTEVQKRIPWEAMEDNLEKYIKQFPSRNGLDRLRTKVSNECKEAGQRPQGIYCLTLPTGSGKTLAVMRFALDHAKRHGLKKIFYVAPYISIVDQNAAIYRDALDGGDGNLGDLILEHHSNVFFDQKPDEMDEKSSEKDDQESELQKKYDYFSQTWDSPVILTTMVQLLHVMFSDNKRDVRRFHALENSVIIIDEIQSLPAKTLALFNEMLNGLSQVFGTTFVLCSATQPPLYDSLDSKDNHRVPSLIRPKEPYLTENYAEEIPFQRVVIKYKFKPHGYGADDIANLIVERMQDSNNLLLILNTRSIVKKVYEHVVSGVAKCRIVEEEVYMLTNDMVPAHRLKVIDTLRLKLKRKERVICISTTLLEAGVDISFSNEIRSMTGMDSMSQAAGRCNRNGESDFGELWIINTKDAEEDIKKMKEMKIARDTAGAMVGSLFRTVDDMKDSDFFSDARLDQYFKRYYWEQGKTTHYPIGEEACIKNLNIAEGTTILDLLSENSVGRKAYTRKSKYTKAGSVYPHILGQAFRTGGKCFQVIDDNTISILVPWKSGKEIIAALASEQYHGPQLQRLLRKVQRYTVQVMPWVYKKLEKEGAIDSLMDGNILVLKEGYYDEKSGLSLTQQQPDTYNF